MAGHRLELDGRAFTGMYFMRRSADTGSGTMYGRKQGVQIG